MLFVWFVWYNNVWVRLICVLDQSLTCSRRPAPAPGLFCTAPQLEENSWPLWWRAPLSCCFAGNQQLSASDHEECMPRQKLNTFTHRENGQQHKNEQFSVSHVKGFGVSEQHRLQNRTTLNIFLTKLTFKYMWVFYLHNEQPSFWENDWYTCCNNEQLTVHLPIWYTSTYQISKQSTSFM